MSIKVKFTRKIGAVLAAVCLMATLTSCVRENRLLVGIDINQMPLSYRNSDGGIAGFEIDMASEAAKRAGVTVKFVPVSWANAQSALAEKQVNSLWGELPSDSPAAAGMLMTKPILRNSQVILVPKDTGITGKDSLAGKAVGILSGSMAAQILTADPVAAKLDGGAPQIFSDSGTMFQALESYQLDAVCLDDTMAEYYIMQHASDYTILPDALSTQQYVVAFRRNDSMLCGRIQKALDSMYRDGTDKTLSQKWFGKDLTLS